MDPTRTRRFVDDAWERSILPALEQYIEIPNKSPAFDRDWQTHGYMERALQLIAQWCQSEQIPGAELSIERSEGRTPLLLLDVPGEAGDPVLIYGHYDKQPEFTGWREGYGPWTPCSKAIASMEGVGRMMATPPSPG